MKCRFQIDGLETCERTALDDDHDGYCICHSHLDTREPGQIMQQIEYEMNKLGPSENTSYDYRGWDLPADCVQHLASKHPFQAHVDLSDAILHNAVFDGINFNQGVSFAGAEFKGKAVFKEGGVQNRPCDFRRARFRDSLSVEDLNIVSRIVFDKARFQGIGLKYSSGKTLGHDASFKGIDVAGDAAFSGPGFGHLEFTADSTFHGNVDLSTAGLNSVAFTDVKIEKKLSLRNNTVNGSVSLTRCCLFEVDFSKGEFQALDLNDGTVKGPANFEGLTCSGGFHFSGLAFRGEADFSQARTGSSFVLENCSFAEKVSFSGLSEKVGVLCALRFTGIHFSGPTTLDGTRFSLGWSLVQNVFEEPVTFEGAAWGEAAIFDRVRFHAACDLRSVDLSKVTFIRMNLTHCSFLHATGLSNARLDGVSWLAEGRRPGQLSDEYYLTQNREFLETDREGECDLVGQLYSDLKKNYEDRRDFRTAGLFHYGEIEMRRLAHPHWLSRLLFSWDAAYKLVSGYGERIYRAPAILAILTVVFGLIYWRCGVTPLGIPWQGPGNCLSQISDPFVYAFTVPPLKPWKNLAPVDGFSSYVRLLNTIVTPALAALFVLAVRRRFRR